MTSIQVNTSSEVREDPRLARPDQIHQAQFTQSANGGRTDAVEVDRDGALVTLEPRVWFVCFVPGLKRLWWHPIVHEKHKHVFAIRPESTGAWTVFEPWWSRLLTASITSEQARKFLEWATTGDVLLAREDVPGAGCQIRGWMTCAVLVGFLLGRGYRAWTPHRLYTHLSRELGLSSVDVSALLELGPEDLLTVSKRIAWRDRHFKFGQSRLAGIDRVDPGRPVHRTRLLEEFVPDISERLAATGRSGASRVSTI